MSNEPQENVLSFICDAYHVQNENLNVPQSLSMKKDVSNHREVRDLKAYRTKNGYLFQDVLYVLFSNKAATNG